MGLLQIFTASSFYSLDIIFWVQKFFIFNGVQFINYFLHGLWLWCCVFDIPKIFSSMLFSRSFIILHFSLFLVFYSFKVVYLGVFFFVFVFFLHFIENVLLAFWIETGIYLPGRMIPSYFCWNQRMASSLLILCLAPMQSVLHFLSAMLKPGLPSTT